MTKIVATPSLEESQWLQHLYTQAPVAIGVYMGNDHIIEFANPKMCEIWGRTKEQVLNKPLFVALPEVSGQGFEEILAKVVSSGEPFSGSEMPAPLERKGRIELCYFNILYQPLLSNEGEIIGVIQVANEVTNSVKARQKAERNEEVLKVALEAGKMGTWHEDLIVGTTTRSIGYDQIFGYAEAVPEWNFPILLAHVAPEDRAMVKEIYQQALVTGYLDCQMRIRRADKQICWIHLKGEASFNIKGVPTALSGIVMDITAQKQAAERETQVIREQAARQEAEKQWKLLQEIFMDAPAMICTFTGPDHIFDLVNPLYQQLFSNRQLQGKTILEALPELKDQPFKTILDNVYKTGETYIGNEVRVNIDRFNNGTREEIYVNFIYKAMHDVTGKINGILVFAYEITEQLLARKKIEQSEQNLRLALEAGKMGTWQLDLQTNESIRSLQHDQLFGYTSLLPHWGLEQFVNHAEPAEQPRVQELFKKALTTGELNAEIQIRRTDGTTRWLVLRGQTFYEEKVPTRMAGVVMDITDKKVDEEKLQSLSQELASTNEKLAATNEALLSNNEALKISNEQLGKVNVDLDNFVYAASHDLKSPVNSLKGLLALFRKRMNGKLDEDALHVTSLIDESITRLSRTVEDLTQIAKVQRNLDDKRETVYFSDILVDIKADLQDTIQEAGVEIQEKVEVASVVYSRQNVRSILFNLLSNAIKYRSTERPAKISIDTKLVNNQVMLSITDNGLGLSALQQQNLFTMFRRFHDHVEGSGVGLYMIKRMLENNGGSIAVESIENEGSTFTVYF
ncbi:PAS domain S-box protein [Rhodocytophaga aerolata]|uniref:histidine kinase n=1 Tax=Rhodocytophaga aerolata TaxID=455078 RepID=A0ABT8RCS3_9BACT|nr:PAS domain S-box protein [Rhodocytophaga aerolata]MDO1449033.1 PAS domain S-box protein [Rhodocytophaga aerolata]